MNDKDYQINKCFLEEDDFGEVAMHIWSDVGENYDGETLMHRWSTEHGGDYD